MAKKILMFVPEHNFREEEYRKPKRLFELKGLVVTTCSTRRGPLEGMLGETIEADLLLEDVAPRDYDALVLVGGLGASKYNDNEAVHNLVRRFNGEGKLVAAISFAPTILAHAGLLTGKPATVFSSERTHFLKLGIKYTARKVEVVENIITSDHPLSAVEFAKAIIEFLAEGKARSVENPLVGREVTSFRQPA